MAKKPMTAAKKEAPAPAAKPAMKGKAGYGKGKK